MELADVVDLVTRARAVGRAAEPSIFHTDVLARLLGWEGIGIAAAVVDPAFVAHATDADVLLVVVDGGIAEVDPAAATITPLSTIGDEGWCRVDAPVTKPSRRLNVDDAIATATIVRVADAVGAAEAALDAAVAHVLERQQYGAPLGALPPVQHRCADMLIDVTIALDAVLDAAGEANDRPLAAAYAKATAIERCRRVTAHAHQLAGGQGILDAAPFHRWYRRVKVAEAVHGGTRHHRAVIATALLE
jgi:hypothetical protein